MNWNLDSLKQSLGEFGNTILEATGERVASEIRNRDGIASPEAPEVTLVDGQPRVKGQATPVSETINGTLRGIDPKMAALAVAGLVGLFVIARRL